MATDSFFTLMCGGLIALLLGLALCLGGYRLFLFLIPIWAFFFGFGLGAQSIQAIFGEAFLATIASWAVGFIVALIFAVLSYLFYVAAVALVAGSLGYALAVGLLQAIGVDFGLIAWLVGLVAGVALAVVTLRFNLQKWIIIAATSFMGAGVIVGVFLALFGKLPSAELVQNPVRLALQNSPFWLIVFLIVSVLGMAAQATVNRRVEVQVWENRI
jgi:hypothetical protein